jgi:hypothetical protein
MRSVCGFALLFSTGLFAQSHNTGFVTTPGVIRSFPSVVHPGGTSALPGVQRTTGSVVFPGGGGPQIAIPAIPFGVPGRTGIVNTGRNGRNFNNGFNRDGFNRDGFNKDRFNNGFNNNGTIVPYPVPVYVGGGYGGGYYDQPPAEQAPAQQPPNVIVIMPPSSGYPGSGYPGMPAVGPAGAPPQSSMMEVPQGPPQPETGNTATHYLIALKDHSIYSAVAYFVEGDTLHYFTTGNTHSQISVSLVDRDLTHRLNEDSGLEVKLPPGR